MTAPARATVPVFVPTGAKRPPVKLPDWFRPAASRSGAPILLLSDSHGHNLEDLLLAFLLADQGRGRAEIVVADDQRDPVLCRRMIAMLLDEGRVPDVVVGHFSSPVARSAASVYRKRAIPFFAPGSSADDLAQDRSAPIFQLFGRDHDQVAAIARGLGADPAPLAVGQTNNAGEALMAALARRIGPGLLRHTAADQITAEMAAGRSLAVLGSKEYAAESLELLGNRTLAPACIILSDDSLGSAYVATAARKIGCPIHVAALKRKTAAHSEASERAERLADAAMRTLGREPGPFFLTSWFAICLALDCLECGLQHPQDILGHLRRQPVQTPFGEISFTETGQSVGFEWELMRLS